MSKVDNFSNSVNYKVISFNEEQSLDSDSLKKCDRISDERRFSGWYDHSLLFVVK